MWSTSNFSVEPQKTHLKPSRVSTVMRQLVSSGFGHVAGLKLRCLLVALPPTLRTLPAWNLDRVSFSLFSLAFCIREKRCLRWQWRQSQVGLSCFDGMFQSAGCVKLFLFSCGIPCRQNLVACRGPSSPEPILSAARLVV